MANIEQKRVDLEKALQAIDEDEMETVVGGLSKNAKLALKIGGSVAVALLGAAGVGTYFAAKHNSKSSTTKPIKWTYNPIYEPVHEEQEWFYNPDFEEKNSDQ